MSRRHHHRPGPHQHPAPSSLNSSNTVPATKEETFGARGPPGHPARQPGHRHTPTPKSRSTSQPGSQPGQRPVPVNHQG
jgi:hypothetical protein